MPRGLDVILSLMAVIAFLPLLALIAIINYVITGRILYRQVRIGRRLRPFVIFKFQTMREGAERGGSVTVARDRRTTPFGRVLRATKLDELPQLFNVLRGDMSLVGPRALTPNEVAHVPISVAAAVYAVRPGMSGVAALILTDEERLLAGSPDPVALYYRTVLPQKMAWESRYVQHKTFMLDLVILLGTPFAIVFPEIIRRLLGGMIAETAAESRGQVHRVEEERI